VPARRAEGRRERLDGCEYLRSKDQVKIKLFPIAPGRLPSAAALLPGNGRTRNSAEFGPGRAGAETLLLLIQCDPT